MRKIAIVGSNTISKSLAVHLSQSSHNEVVFFDVKNQNSNASSEKQQIANQYQFSLDVDLENLNQFDAVFLDLSTELIFKNNNFIKNISEDTLVINLTNGIDENGVLINTFLKSNYNLSNVVSLKGAVTSQDLSSNSPTLLTLAYTDYKQIDQVKEILEETNLFLDFTSDIAGVEYLSIIKDIYALFFGFIDAAYSSQNTKFFIFTKSIKEIRTILRFLKCRDNTILLSCGIGDFGLKSTNDYSRYRTLGILIGKNMYKNNSFQNDEITELKHTLHFLNKHIPEKLLSDNLPILKSLINFFIHDVEKLEVDFSNLQKRKYKVVLTYGTFDLMHYGHLELLKRAKDFGDRLIVGLSSDDFNLQKGKVSEFNFEKRKKYLESLEYVDLVIPENNWEQKIEDVKKYQVDFFVMGNDWEGKFDELKDFCQVVYLPRTEDISSSLIKEILKKE